MLLPRIKYLLAMVVLQVLLLSGCQTASYHASEVRNAQGQDSRVTVGTVQRKIKKGMTGAEVIKALGSPNIVTKNKNDETWVYDKFSTETIYSTSEGGVAALVVAGGPSAAGAIGGGVNQRAGAATQSQKTLTIIITFADSVVSEFTYHSSRF